MSPLMKLSEQIHGYNKCGLYHDDIRLDKINGFKVQHMYFRKEAPRHPHMKFNFSEEDLMESVCQMEPIYDRRSSKMNVVFRAGDYRSTLDDKDMARASAAREEALELNQKLLERLRELNQNRRSASREELMNAMLHYFLAVGVDDDELGDLSLERMPKPIGPAEEGPVPIYNCRSKYTALVLNLGSFARNRKRSTPSVFSEIIDHGDSGESVGLLLKSIAHAKAHLFLLCEAGDLNERELKFLHSRGWETQRNPNGELLVGCRTNGQGSSMTMLAGSTLVGVAHNHLPLTKMIVDINQGKTLPHGSQGSGMMRDQIPKASLTAPLTRAGMNSIRVCVFHLSSHVASGQVSLPHEALASMFIDCLFYQVDFIGGDPNMAPNRARWTYRVGCIRASYRISSRGGSNHRGLCRFAFPERSIAAQTVFYFSNILKMLLAAVPTRTVLRSIGTPFLVLILWLRPFWNGDIRLPMTNGQSFLKMPKSSS